MRVYATCSCGHQFSKSEWDENYVGEMPGLCWEGEEQSIDLANCPECHSTCAVASEDESRVQR